MTNRIVWLVFAMAFTAASCGLAEGPRQKLKHTALKFNEGLRWGRYSEVYTRVDPKALDHFMEMHKDWGSEIRIENAEMVRFVVDEKAKKASIVVSFTWYRITEMVVHDTMTVQHWERREGEWMMIAEEYQSGTPF